MIFSRLTRFFPSFITVWDRMAPRVLGRILWPLLEPGAAGRCASPGSPPSTNQDGGQLPATAVSAAPAGGVPGGFTPRTTFSRTPATSPTPSRPPWHQRVDSRCRHNSTPALQAEQLRGRPRGRAEVGWFPAMAPATAAGSHRPAGGRPPRPGPPAPTRFAVQPRRPRARLSFAPPVSPAAPPTTAIRFLPGVGALHHHWAFTFLAAPGKLRYCRHTHHVPRPPKGPAHPRRRPSFPGSGPPRDPRRTTVPPRPLRRGDPGQTAQGGQLRPHGAAGRPAVRLGPLEHLPAPPPRPRR